jgi:hypothetical protein
MADPTNSRPVMLSHSRPLSLAAILVACLSCTRDAERAGTDTAAAAPPPAAPSPTTPATGEWAITERGIGALSAGATIDEAQAALGGRLELRANANPECDYATIRGAPSDVLVMITQGRIARIDVRSAGVETAAGAKVGDTEDRIQSLYPGRVRVSPHKYVDGHYLSVPLASDTMFAIVFETDGTQVTRFRSGKKPEVDYVEGCS